jgi:lysozyme|tara:strand:+ start:1133 stop:1573 length:441 start_codon:yes stop_codon:yes gene_type:complete
MDNQIANNIIEIVKQHEGFRNKVYICPTGHETIGYGFKVSDLYIDEDLAHEMLVRILAKKEQQMRDTFDWIDDMPILIQEVILNMCYQMGVNGVSKFKKMIKALKNEEWADAANEMLDSKWARSDSPHRAKELSDIVISLAEGYYL